MALLYFIKHSTLNNLWPFETVERIGLGLIHKYLYRMKRETPKTDVGKNELNFFLNNEQLLKADVA